MEALEAPSFAKTILVLSLQPVRPRSM